MNRHTMLHGVQWWHGCDHPEEARRARLLALREAVAALRVRQADPPAARVIANPATYEERIRLLRETITDYEDELAKLRPLVPTLTAAFGDAMLALEEEELTGVAERLRTRWPEAAAGNDA